MLTLNKALHLEKDWDEKIEEGLKHRFQGVVEQGAQIITDNDLAQYISSIMPSFSCLDTNNKPRFEAYSYACSKHQYSRWKRRFTLPKSATEDIQINIINRNTNLANTVLRHRQKGRFLMNWKDAQGWNYSDILANPKTPITLQSTRRRGQKNIALMPLPKAYHGSGGFCIPEISDPVAFDEKENTIFWRGTVTGIFGADWKDISTIKAAKNYRQIVTSDLKDSQQLQQIQSLPRVELIQQLSKKPLFDCAFVAKKRISNTNPSIKDFLQALSGHRVQIHKQYRYKFLLAIPGNDCASNIFWVLRSNSILMMVDSEWETALHAGLQPWVHYVPVKANIEDILEKHNKLLSDESLCREIISNAQQFMQWIIDPTFRDQLDHYSLKNYLKMTRQ